MFVFFCGLGDAASTWLGLSFSSGRLFELNPGLGVFGYVAPFISTALFCLVLLVTGSRQLPVAESWRVLLQAGLCLVALSPIVNNLQVMLSAAF